MEATTNNESRRREDMSYVLYSPCHLCGEFVKAFLKCLGFDSTTTPHDTGSPPPLPQESTDTTTRGVIGEESIGIGRVTVRRRPPPLPPVSRGSGGQIH